MPSLSNTAAQTLQRQIFSGHYKPDSALPPQRELSASLGISRASLREAISMLEALGLLRSHPGKGVFVTSGNQPSNNSLPNGPSAVLPAHIYQLRYVIEPANASLSAQQKNAIGVSKLKASLEAMQAALTTCDLVTAAEEDLCFHLAVAEFSGNPGLLAITEQFRAQLAYSLRLPFSNRTQIWRPVDEHQDIFECIAGGDAEGARRAMQKHVVAAANRVDIFFTQP